MDLEDIIKIVTDLVYEKLGEKSLATRKKNLILVGESEEIKRKYGLFVPNWDNIDFLDSKTKSVDIYEFIICTQLSNHDLIDISMGRGGSQISKLIIEAIFKGKDIVCINEGLEYIKYEKTANKPFYKMFQEYKKSLEAYQIKFVSYYEIDKILNEKGWRSEVELISSAYKTISFSLVDEILKKGIKTIKLSKNSIITPLAKDYIREQGVELIFY